VTQRDPSSHAHASWRRLVFSDQRAAAWKDTQTWSMSERGLAHFGGLAEDVPCGGILRRAPWGARYPEAETTWQPQNIDTAGIKPGPLTNLQ
jgi:hypothetical protein